MDKDRTGIGSVIGTTYGAAPLSSHGDALAPGGTPAAQSGWRMPILGESLGLMRLMRLTRSVQKRGALSRFWVRLNSWTMSHFKWCP
jgi:hypothetical protein